MNTNNSNTQSVGSQAARAAMLMLLLGAAASAADLGDSTMDVKAATPTSLGDIKTTFEFELFGTGNDGPEIQWGRRENFRDGFASDRLRLQFSVKYNFTRTLGDG